MNKQYTQKEKLEVLKIHRIHGRKYGATARITGVARNTIRSWDEKHGSKLEDSEAEHAQVTEVVKDFAAREELLIDKYFQIKSAIVDKLIEITNDTRDLDKASRALKTLSELDGSFPRVSNLKQTRGSHNTLYQEISDRLIETSNNLKHP